MHQEERIVCFDKELKIEAYRFKGIMQRFPNHFHEYYVIGFIENGKRRLSCRNKEYILGPGDLVLFNPNDSHTCEQVDNKSLDYRCINIKSEIMEKIVGEITGKEYLPQFSNPVVYRCEQVSLLYELHKMIMEEYRDFEKEEIFFFLIEQLIKDYTQNLPQETSEVINKKIQIACDYMEKNFSQFITLDYLSEITGLNKYSMIRSFTKHKGITPYQYLKTIRVNEAKKLLEKGLDPLEAGMQTGFVDQSHFTNFFKKFIGLTPGQYRNIFLDEDK